MKNKKKFLIAFFIICLSFIMIGFAQNNQKNDPKLLNGFLKIHYLDVSQGDAIFIELPNKQTMLIDAGEAKYGEIVGNYIRKLDYNIIDYVIGTHPHSDHIGGLSYIIDNFEVKNIYMPKVSTTTKTYENLLNTILNSGLKVKTAFSNVDIIDTDVLKVNFLAPNSNKYAEINNYSAVLKITYRQRKFIFMGDAENISEEEITSNVTADVIKIGHHGSNSSTSNEFLNKVNPKYAVIMVGVDNKYGHPHNETIAKLVNKGITTYQTDLNGNIVVITNGLNLRFETDK